MAGKPTPSGQFAVGALLSAAVLGGLSPVARAAETVSEQDAHSIGVAAYIYFYSLVTMDVTRKQLTNVAKAEGMHADEHVRHSGYPTASMKAVVRPNFDTLYTAPGST